MTTTSRSDAELLRHAVLQVASVRGILGAAARYHLARPGKQLRGLLAMRVAQSLGVPFVAARDLGVACELLHNASLVHDDVQDRDVLRRGREAAWSRFGDPIAINLGDHLLVSTFRVLAGMRAPSGTRAELTELFATATTEIARGQSDEILRRQDLMLDLETYESIARSKTGPLLAVPIEGALLLAGANLEARSAARRGGTLLGTAFQILDDVADLLDRKERSEPGADLREGKLDWPALAFLEQAEESTRRKFLGFLASPHRRVADPSPWTGAIRMSGAVERAFARTDELLREASGTWHPLPHACRDALAEQAVGIRNWMTCLDGPAKEIAT